MSSLVALKPQARVQSLAQMKRSPFLLLDTSSSMAARLSDEERRIDALRSIVAKVRSSGVPFRQVVFSSDAMLSESIPEPSGSTDLTAALTLAMENNASKIVVVSDGEPNNERTALEAGAQATRMGIVIDIFHIGEPGSDGERFMKQLASLTGGNQQTVDLDIEPKQLVSGAIAALTDGSEKQQGPIAL